MKLKKFESFRDHDLLEMYMVEVRNLCQQYKIVNYTINSDFSIDVEGNVDLRDLELVRLPLKFRKVKGAFYCNNNQLTSLLGSPIEVTSDFACSNNQLTT